jgi:hypothetical protein
MNCVPCQKLGLSVVAHYQAGGGKPAQCYHHHFGMPLPKALQDKIVPAPPPAAQTSEQHVPSRVPMLSAEPELAGVPAFRAKHFAKTKNGRRAEPKRATSSVYSVPNHNSHHSNEKVNTMPAITDTKRSCAHPACGTPITERNTSGCCAKHFYWSKKNSRSRRATRSVRKASPPRKSIAKPNGSLAVATICVTESNLDAFWSRLSIEEKANLFAMQLEAAN